ncbi:MAG: HPr-rel-A system PqqD family peptide chaperone, partial [Sphingobium sp.]
ALDDIVLIYHRPSGQTHRVASPVPESLAALGDTALGEAGFSALSRFVGAVPARAIDFASGDEAVALVERLWGELG